MFPVAALAEWSSNDQEARALIMSTLTNQLQYSVSETTTSKECWDELSACFERIHKPHLAHFMKKVFRSTLSDSEPLQPQISELERCAHIVSSLGIELDDKVIAIAITLSLPPSLSDLQDILLSPTALDQLSTAHVTRVILDCELLRGAKGKDNSKERQKKHCTHCNKRGHDIGECRKLKGAQEMQTAPNTMVHPPTISSPNAAPATAPTSVTPTPNEDSVLLLPDPAAVNPVPGEDIACLSLAFPPNLNLQHDWVVLTTATRSMCSNRAWFSQFTPFAQPARVRDLLGNGVLYATGVGNIPVRVRAGERWSRALLQEILFVPDLCCNVLSVRHLTDRDGEVEFSGSGCRVYRPQGHLFCEGRVRGNLFLLEMRHDDV